LVLVSEDPPGTEFGVTLWSVFVPPVVDVVPVVDMVDVVDVVDVAAF
jgi:hypothetical protein